MSHETPFVAYGGDEPYLFASYSHRDSGTVLPIIGRLHDAGYRIWYDEGIDPGSEWPEMIAQRLKGATLMACFISPNSVASHNVRQEITYAGKNKIPILSVMLQETEVPAGIELQLGLVQGVHYYRYAQFDDFVVKLKNVLEPLLDHNAAGQRAPGLNASPAPGMSLASTSSDGRGRPKPVVLMGLIAVAVALAGGLFVATRPQVAPAAVAPQVSGQPVAPESSAVTPAASATTSAGVETPARPVSTVPGQAHGVYAGFARQSSARSRLWHVTFEFAGATGKVAYRENSGDSPLYCAGHLTLTNDTRWHEEITLGTCDDDGLWVFTGTDPLHGSYLRSTAGGGYTVAGDFYRMSG